MCKTRDYNSFTGGRWIYRCESGEYRESNFVGLLYTIFLHRLSHLIKGEGFRD
jgi:hypothetical protein